MLGRIDILMGGRCAEKLIFNDTSTGAGNDIEVATNIARKMVCDWGMSDKIGPLKFGKKDEEVFLGRDYSQQKNYSEEKSIIIDHEISAFVKKAELNADKILSDYRHQLDDIAKVLLDKETISGDEMRSIIEGVAEETPKEEPSVPKTSRRQSNQEN
jgi:cell division protease FtsH